MLSFKDKTVVITGAAGGIGQGLATTFSELGANIVLVDLAKANAPNEQTLVFEAI